MKCMKVVSIIIPVYNAENTLKRCMESIMCQTYKYWEVWLIDDGSCDASGEICDYYSEADSRIYTVHKKNEGVSAARNVGIDNASGEYVMFVDSDDFLEKNALELLVEAVENYDADVAMCGFFYCLEEKNERTSNYIKDFFVGGNEKFVPQVFQEAFRKELLNPPWNKVIRKSLLERNKIRFVSEYSICEDMIFTMEILKVSKRIAFLNVPLYYYVYKKGDNLVNRFHKNFYEALSAYYDMTVGYLEKYNALSDIYYDTNCFFADKSISYLKKIYTHVSYDNSMKYQELRRICDDLRRRGVLREYKHMGFKKKVVSIGARYKLYRLLHLLYLIT